MSLWDVVAGVSYGRNIRHPGEDGSNILKKINSATLNVLNGEKVDYVGAGGRTTNTFGVVTMINCDMGAVIQGHFSPKTQQWTGAWFGPGVVNLMNIGNKTKLQYMPEKSSNYNFRRGGAEINMIYEYEEGAEAPKTAITVLIFLFALSIFGFYLIYNFFGACGKDKMSPVGDSEYIKDQQGKLQTTDKEIAELEASEAQQEELQQQHAAEGYVPSPEEQKAQDEELEYTEKQLTAAESQKTDLEISLKKAERQKDWLIFGNVILENRGFWVIKTVEQFKGALEISWLRFRKTEQKVKQLEIIIPATITQHYNSSVLTEYIEHVMIDNTGDQSIEVIDMGEEFLATDIRQRRLLDSMDLLDSMYDIQFDALHA